MPKKEVHQIHLAVLQPIMLTEQGGAHASLISHHTVHLRRRQVQYVIGPDSSFLPNWPNPVSAYLHQFFNDVSPLFQWSPLAWANNNSLAVLVFALNYSPLPCDDETSPFFAMHYTSCITYASSATLLPAKFNDMHRSTYSQSRSLSSQCISTSSLCRHLHHSHRNGEALDRRRHARMPPAQCRVSQQERPQPPIVISLMVCLNVRPYTVRV